MIFDPTIKYLEEQASINSSINIESIDKFEDKKLSIVITYRDETMVSIELLEDGTCDLTMVDIESEKVIKYRLLRFSKEEEMKTGIKQFLD
ncbi:MAG: hypothetical protein ACFB0B_17630 [Thermonemataceae bacterium]